MVSSTAGSTTAAQGIHCTDTTYVALQGPDCPTRARVSIFGGELPKKWANVVASMNAPTCTQSVDAKVHTVEA